MKINELKSWLWNTVLESDPKIPLNAQVVLDVEGAYIYTIDENLKFVKHDNEEVTETISLKKFLDAAEAHGDEAIDCGHEFTGSWIYARRSFGNILWITLVPNDGEVPEVAGEVTGESPETTEG